MILISDLLYFVSSTNISDCEREIFQAGYKFSRFSERRRYLKNTIFGIL